MNLSAEQIAELLDQINENTELQSRIEELADMYEKGNAALIVQVKRAVKAEAQIKEYDETLEILEQRNMHSVKEFARSERTRIAALTGEDDE